MCCLRRVARRVKKRSFSKRYVLLLACFGSADTELINIGGCRVVCRLRRAFLHWLIICLQSSVNEGFFSFHF